MAGRGPAPSPIERKKRLGNPGKRSLPTPKTAIAPMTVINSPKSVPRDGEALVTALLEAGAAAWIGTTDQLATLRLVQDGWDRRAALMAFLAENGSTYSSGGGKYPLRYYRRPESVELEALEKQITSWLSQLGLNPADRGRLGLAEVKARSKLEEMRERRAKLVAGRPGG